MNPSAPVRFFSPRSSKGPRGTVPPFPCAPDSRHRPVCGVRGSAKDDAGGGGPAPGRPPPPLGPQAPSSPSAAGRGGGPQTPIAPAGCPPGCPCPPAAHHLPRGIRLCLTGSDLQSQHSTHITPPPSNRRPQGTLRWWFSMILWNRSPDGELCERRQQHVFGGGGHGAAEGREGRGGGGCRVRLTVRGSASGEVVEELVCPKGRGPAGDGAGGSDRGRGGRRPRRAGVARGGWAMGGGRAGDGSRMGRGMATDSCRWGQWCRGWVPGPTNRRGGGDGPFPRAAVTMWAKGRPRDTVWWLCSDL